MKALIFQSCYKLNLDYNYSFTIDSPTEPIIIITSKKKAYKMFIAWSE